MIVTSTYEKQIIFSSLEKNSIDWPNGIGNITSKLMANYKFRNSLLNSRLSTFFSRRVSFLRLSHLSNFIWFVLDRWGHCYSLHIVSHQYLFLFDFSRKFDSKIITGEPPLVVKNDDVWKQYHLG